MSKVVVAEAALGSLKPGVNFLKSGGRSFILFNEEGGMKACENICNHQRGKFVRDIEDDVVKCSRHGWKLDCRRMRYVDPPDGQQQKELEVVVCDETVKVIELVFRQPWEDIPPKSPLIQGEFTIRYYNHACMSVKCGPLTLFTDPWLTGPAMCRGWWLLHRPPADWLEKLAAADLVYISHRHTDHLNYPTLKKLAEVNPKIRFVMARMTPPVWQPPCSTLPFPIQEVELGAWTQFGEHGRFMILGDSLLSDIDTGILIEYKGHSIFNAADCSNPNGGVLPKNLDVLMCEFSGGSSIFPLIFTEMYGDDVRNLVAKKGKALIAKVICMIKDTNARCYIPFAGSFTEAHPCDELVKHNNFKTSSTEMCEIVRKSKPDVLTWDPWPGGHFDMSTLEGEPVPPDANIYMDSWECEWYDEQARECLSKIGERSLTDMKAYWKWLDFKNYDLVLHVQETTPDFSETLREYFVDFLDLSFPSVRPPGRPYIRFRIRSLAAHLSVTNDIPWHDILMGFHVRVFVEPHVYHYPFYEAIANINTKPPLFTPCYTDI